LEERFVVILGILDSVAAQDLTKDPSPMANVGLHFPHLVLEGQLESHFYFVIMSNKNKLART